MVAIVPPEIAVANLRLSPDLVKEKLRRNQYKVWKDWGDCSVEEFWSVAEGYFKRCDEKELPYTITGLALAYNVYSSSIYDWSMEESVKGDLIRKARMILLNQAETNLRSGKNSNVIGTIFWLKNTFGWRDIKPEESTADKALDVLKAFIEREKRGMNVFSLKSSIDSKEIASTSGSGS